MAMNVHQCPRCELRFTNANELRDHFSLDHRADPDTFDRYRYAPPSRRATATPARRYLVVANQTLTADHLGEAIRQRLAQGPALFYVLVPATHSAAQVSGPAGDATSTDDADDAGLAMARHRLRTAIDRLHDEGVDAEGQVGHPDPLTAVSRLLHEQSFDEILLSTLPPGLSGWLKVDLPHRLERRCRIPVTTLTGQLTRA
jgi:hypothetical protein